MSYIHLCALSGAGLCSNAFEDSRHPSDFHGPCPSCIERSRASDADARERAARIARGDLSLCEDATADEVADILRARRGGNFGGVSL